MKNQPYSHEGDAPVLLTLLIILMLAMLAGIIADMIFMPRELKNRGTPHMITLDDGTQCKVYGDGYMDCDWNYNDAS